jgi:hypothetical protein
MTPLRPLVIPAAAILLATGASSAEARTRRPVDSVWATSLQPAHQTAVSGKAPARALPVHVAKSLPLATRVTPGETAVPGGCYPAAAKLTGAAAAGRPTTATARGPPS